MKERWKQAFEENPETTLADERINLTAHQKDWIKRAWVHFFGFLPNAIPIYNEREGFAFRPGIDVQLHHITPVGESSRIYGEDHFTYNDPRNIAPISVINHTGRGADSEDYVIHEDMRDMNVRYSSFRKGEIENPYETMAINRTQLTDAGLPYHETSYDRLLLDLADRVVSQYIQDYPDDAY